MCLHESQWSKRPRIEPGHDGFDHCENFVAAESLQLRNAHVYLAARHWARWARDGGTGAHRDDGPVVAAVAEAGVPGPTPPWWRPEQAGLHWDHDPLTNVVLYNEHALVVVDRNGGRITQVFALVGDRPVAVSGTFKAYQFVDADWASDSGVECDGLVLQNTVWSPNHGYVACDVEASRGTLGSRPPNDRGLDLYYPDNFNLYDEVPGDPLSVTFAYGPGTGETPPASVDDLDGAARARPGREAGRAARDGAARRRRVRRLPQDGAPRRPDGARRLPGRRAGPPGRERVLRRPARSGPARAPADACGRRGRAQRHRDQHGRPRRADRARVGVPVLRRASRHRWTCRRPTRCACTGC